MLTYVPDADREAPLPPNQQPWLLLLLCLVWLIPGLIGHDPWKPAELETAAVIKHFMQGQHWTLPWYGDSAYLIHGPLYYWSAALVAWPLHKLGMEIHDAARVVTGLWMSLAMWGVGLAGRELYGRRQGRVGVMALIGSIGLIIWGHHLAPDLLLLVSFAWQIYALAWALRQPVQGGLLLGLSWLVLLLGASWGEFILSVLTALALLIWAPWRKGWYAATLVTALVVAIPLGMIWPVDLYHFSPTAFQTWYSYYALGPLGGMAAWQMFHSFGYFFSIVLWFAWPVLPLAAWGAWSNRAQWQSPKVVLPLTIIVLNSVWLAGAGDTINESALLIILPVLSVLSIGGIDRLQRGAAAALNWFGIMTFGLGTLLLWAAWLVVQTGMPGSWARSLAQASPAWHPHIGGLGTVFTVLISIAWCLILLRKRPLGRLAVTNWAVGVTLLWGALMGLWQPWLDASKSYRPVVRTLAAEVARQPAGCVDGSLVSDSMAASVDYFSSIALRRRDVGDCHLQLLQGDAQPGTMLLWEGARPGERHEHFYLIKR
ncbi:glycosyltransferase family 39 protein [Silvimonas sp. JCM 19000]